MGLGASKQLKIPPGGGFGRGVKFLIYFWEGGGGGGPSNLETALAIPLTLIYTDAPLVTLRVPSIVQALLGLRALV